MIRDRDDLIACHIRSARFYLDEAELLAGCGHANEVINRLYYACLYAVKALLCSRGLSANKHSAVRSLFVQHFVKKGLIAKELAAFYNDLFESRQEGDCEDFFRADLQLVTIWLGQAQQLIEAIDRLLPDRT